MTQSTVLGLLCVHRLDVQSVGVVSVAVVLRKKGLFHSLKLGLNQLPHTTFRRMLGFKQKFLRRNFWFSPTCCANTTFLPCRSNASITLQCFNTECRNCPWVMHHFNSVWLFFCVNINKYFDSSPI